MSARPDISDSTLAVTREYLQSLPERVASLSDELQPEVEWCVLEGRVRVIFPAMTPEQMYRELAGPVPNPPRIDGFIGVTAEAGW